VRFCELVRDVAKPAGYRGVAASRFERQDRAQRLVGAGEVVLQQAGRDPTLIS